ncbi:uncharacterized protein FIBRA_01912 [Fibroporia radiculosa]|uniref:Glycopeptide n=1 Tax=Fibroporia radiculosa TaxID=599839 RepID=J4HU36_9APHY|nr:uncharacterized protein FIBRA_01912 [Fibroporia radiculosa]CCL99887.1 predicted protein [Fibroporia radiculosa]
MFSKVTIALVAAAMAFVQVRGESHTVTFTNDCGYGTPYLWGPDGVLLSTGSPYTSNGPADGLIAYLQIGPCGNNGENCTLVEASLNNAGGSSADISLIPPHSFTVASGFDYYNGCDGQGTDCTDNDCPDAFREPNQTGFEVVCLAANVDLNIKFCD